MDGGRNRRRTWLADSSSTMSPLVLGPRYNPRSSTNDDAASPAGASMEAHNRYYRTSYNGEYRSRALRTLRLVVIHRLSRRKIRARTSSVEKVEGRSSGVRRNPIQPKYAPSREGISSRLVIQIVEPADTKVDLHYRSSLSKDGPCAIWGQPLHTIFQRRPRLRTVRTHTDTPRTITMASP